MMYEDDMSDELSSSATFDSVFELDEHQHEPTTTISSRISVTHDNQPSSISAARDDADNGELSDELASSVSAARDNDSAEEQSEVSFTYMNAADVAEALHTEPADQTRVRSVHSDQPDDSDPDPSDEIPAVRDRVDNESSACCGSSEAVATPRDVTRSDESRDTRTLEEQRDQELEQELVPPSVWQGDGGSVMMESSEPGLESSESMLPGGSVVESVLPGAAAATDAEALPASQTVTMRRPSRVSPQHAAAVSAAPLAAAAVLELHISSTDDVSLSSLQLEQLSTESGCAVHTLRQFIDNDSDSQTLPSASIVPPGKAFDSLKYFLSTLH